jgi:hypothetical protein
LEIFLATTAWIDSHDKYQVNQGDDFFQGPNRGSGVDANAHLAPQGSNLPQGTVEVKVALDMNDEGIGTGLGERFDEPVGVGDHQMGFNGKFAGPFNSLSNGWPHGKVGDEMAIHHIDMDAVGPGGFCGLNFIA